MYVTFNKHIFMTQIICLANSKKNGDRCIAGIDICSGKWIRPVSNKNDGRVSVNECLVNGEEPKLLDILDIPLEKKGSGYGCENLTIKSGVWEKIGQILPNSLLKYCDSNIFYSQYPEKVPQSFLDKLPHENKRTLQLVKATVSQVNSSTYEDNKKWKASLSISNQQIFTANITDVAMIDKLDQGLNIQNKDCLFTISLGQPWRKPNSDDELYCWKLIAGVIELS